MKTFIVDVIDETKVEFVETLLSQLDGVVYEERLPAQQDVANNNSGQQKPFTNSFGLWENRNIDANDLRAEAWKGRK